MRDRARGFTLIELMIVVAIIGVLAAIAIPTFMGMMKESKRTEGEVFLDMIRKSVKAKVPDRGGFVVGEADLTPAETCCDSGRKDKKCEADASQWTSGDPDDPSAWDELGFKIDEPHYFRYAYEGTSKEFTAIAVGDLDCDGTFVTYTLTGTYVDGQTKFLSAKSGPTD